MAITGTSGTIVISSGGGVGGAALAYSFGSASRLYLGIYSSPTGTNIISVSARVRDIQFSTNEHGYSSLMAFVPLSVVSSFYVYDRFGLPHIAVTDNGAVAWEGRLEDVAIVDGGLRITAFGYQNGFRDKRNSYSPSAYSAATSQTIATDIVSAVSTANTFMSSSTALVSSPGAGVTWTETYARQTPADILDRLAARGDGSTRWEWCVWEGRALAFRARGADGRAWYANVSSDFTLTRTLENVWNSVYGGYADTVTAEAANSFSQSRYGVKREIVVQANTDSSTIAEDARDSFADFYSDSAARGGITIDALYDASGVRWPLWCARSGDTITARNLHQALSSSIDRVRTFRVGETTFGFMGNKPVMTLTPEFSEPGVV